MADILEYLKQHGETMDADIARAMNIPLEKVRGRLLELSQSGDVMLCHTTRFHASVRTEGWSCRPCGIVMPRTAGRKPGS